MENLRRKMPCHLLMGLYVGPILILFVDHFIRIGLAISFLPSFSILSWCLLWTRVPLFFCFFFFLFIRSYRCQNGNQEARKGSLPVTFSLTMDVGCDQFSNFSTRLFVNRLDCRCSSPREQKNIFLWNVSRKKSSRRNLPN